MVQMASLQQLALHSLLLLGRSEAVARRGQSRDRHFARVFAIPVANAADADCVGLWHRMALCSAHGHAGSIASPGGGPLPFWACSTAPARIAAAAATGAAAWALLAMACGRRSASVVGSLSGTSLGLAPDPASATICLARAYTCALLALWGCMLGWAAARAHICRAALVHLL